MNTVRGESKPGCLKAVAFDLDAASLQSLREALPGWEIEALDGATATSLTHDWIPGEADLLVVKVRAEVAITLGLCRLLMLCGVSTVDFRKGVPVPSGLTRESQGQERRDDAPLLILVPSGQESLVGAVFEAGADGCLVLPIHAREVAGMLAHVRQVIRRAGTLNLDHAQGENRWRDDGGQGGPYQVKTVCRGFAGQVAATGGGTNDQGPFRRGLHAVER